MNRVGHSGHAAVTGIAPVVTGEALLSGRQSTQAVLLSGIDPALQAHMSVIQKTMSSGSMDSLRPGSFNIVVGEGIADRYRLGIGGKLTVITPAGDMTPLGLMPRFKRFTVSGIFHAGNGFDFDNSYAFINLKDAQTLYQLGNSISSLRLTVADPFAAPQLGRQLQSLVPALDSIHDWTEQFGAFFEAVALEKHMMFFILLLIIAVAAFNLVSTLVMVVNEKSADIAILRTLGATPKTIMGIFIVQGAVIGIVGTALGVAAGVILSLNITALADALQRVFHIQLVSSSVYIVDYLPSHIQISDVVEIAAAALILSLLATIYPAWRASKIHIAEALRYE